MQISCRVTLTLVGLCLGAILWMEWGLLSSAQTCNSAVEQEPDLGLAAQPSGPRVLLLTYMRAGSSFTSELLTLHPSINYLFEPLWQFRHSHLVIDSVEMKRAVARYLTALYRCDPLLTPESAALETINRVRFEMDGCEHRAMLQKAIRIRGDTVLMMMKMNPQLKVIQLVRDPRAVALSRANVGANPNAKYYCEEIRDDLTMADTLMVESPNRYYSMRYEDLVDRSRVRAELSHLYWYMGVPLPQEEIMRYFSTHYNFTGKQSKYGTKKGSDFDPHQWRQKLSPDQIKQAEEVCADVMERFGYEVYRS